MTTDSTTSTVRVNDTVRTLEGRIQTLERSQRRSRGLLLLAGGLLAGVALAGFTQPEQEPKAKPVSMAFYNDGNEMYLMMDDGSMYKAPMSRIASSNGGQIPWALAGK